MIVVKEKFVRRAVSQGILFLAVVVVVCVWGGGGGVLAAVCTWSEWVVVRPAILAFDLLRDRADINRPILASLKRGTRSYRQTCRCV